VINILFSHIIKFEETAHAYSALTVVTSFSQLFVGSFSTIMQILSNNVHMRRTRSISFALLALFVMSEIHAMKPI